MPEQFDNSLSISMRDINLERIIQVIVKWKLEWKLGERKMLWKQEPQVRALPNFLAVETIDRSMEKIFLFFFSATLREKEVEMSRLFR